MACRTELLPRRCRLGTLLLAPLGALAGCGEPTDPADEANQPPSVTITSPADNATVPGGTSVTFTGTASDPEDGDLSASIVWHSDLDEDLGTGASVTTMLSAGEHQVTASVTDSHGEAQSAAIQLIINPDDPNPSDTWTWISGGPSANQAGVYGTQRSPDPANVPGARQRSVSSIDGSGNVWLFGGSGYDAVGDRGRVNDLWQYDGTNWTWISGSASDDQLGVYGTQGSPDPTNVPGARWGSVSWIDGSGNLWLFGGFGFPASGIFGGLNDLWRYDGSNWTWISGSSSIDQVGVYGTQGTPDPTNVPGARYHSVSWIDGSGNLWLFGGLGYDAAGSVGDLNDVWRYRP